jgi:hypothetical protein
MKDADLHPSDEETAHSFKYCSTTPHCYLAYTAATRSLSLKHPQHFSIEQVERQPELPSPKFSFVDLMNAAPHLAATVQRNVAISIASDALLKKSSDAKNNSKIAGMMTGGSAGPSNSKPHSSKKPHHPALQKIEKAAALSMLSASEIQKALDQSNPNAVYTYPSSMKHEHLKKEKSRLGSKHSGARPPGASSLNAGSVPKAPPSSDINTSLSKKLVRSATHVYIANYIKDQKKAQEAIKKMQEKHQENVQLRQQQEQRTQQRIQQQQMQHQIQQQQQMMHYIQSQQGQSLQSPDMFLTKAGAAMNPPYTAVQHSTSTAKSSQVCCTFMITS